MRQRSAPPRRSAPTRRARADAQSARAAQTQTWGNTGKRTAAPAARPGVLTAASALNGSRSMSTSLIKRSAAEHEQLPDIDAADKENPLAVAEVRPCREPLRSEAGARAARLPLRKPPLAVN